MSCPCIQRCLRARSILLRERQTLLFSSYNIFVFCCLMLHIFCRLFLQGLSLSLFARLVIVPVDSPTFKGAFHCFPTLSSLYFSLSLFEMSPRLPLSFTLIYISWPFGLLFWLQHKCVCVFGLRLCLSNCSVFSASPWTLRSSHWCSTQAFRLYEHFSTYSFPSLASFSSASYMIPFSLCVFL